MAVPDSEVNGFLNGYFDCLPNGELKSLLGRNPTEQIVGKIGDFYYRNVHSDLSIIEVARRIAIGAPPPHQAPDGEVYNGRHGYYNDLWWRGAVAAERVGYVEGYLACLKKPVSAGRSRKLAAAITRWYGSHPKDEQLPIADVLEKSLKAEAPSGGTADAMRRTSPAEK